MTIAEQIKNITSSLPATTRLIAVSKTKPVEDIQEAYDAGQRVFGENKALEMRDKHEALPKDIEWHFIGHLQRNKVNKIVGKVDLIQSVDSEELLRLIDRRALSLGIIQDVLIEISIAGEEQKSGIDPLALPALLAFASQCKGLRVRGLMCVPPVQENYGENRAYFARMKQLFIDNSGKKYDNVSMDFLSMGMSNDYEDAILEGSNMVRVGTAIFGARNYNRLQQ